MGVFLRQCNQPTESPGLQKANQKARARVPSFSTLLSLVLLLKTNANFCIRYVLVFCKQASSTFFFSRFCRFLDSFSSHLERVQRPLAGRLVVQCNQVKIISNINDTTTRRRSPHDLFRPLSTTNTHGRLPERTLQSLDCADHPVSVSSPWYLLDETNAMMEGPSGGSVVEEEMEMVEEVEDLPDDDLKQMLDMLIPADLKFSCADGARSKRLRKKTDDDVLFS